MTAFTISRKLTIKEALETIPQIEQWFKDNPKRKDCKTDRFVVRKGFVGTDILSRTNLTEIK